MDISTLIVARQVLLKSSVRAASRAVGLPVSTTSAALSRLESALCYNVTQKVGPSLMLTIEGRSVMPRLDQAAKLAMKICSVSRRRPISLRQVSRISVNFAALERLMQITKAGSIRRVAQQIKIGQPQLSRQISHLERQLGAVLLLRAKKGVTPTEEGVRVAEFVEQLAEIWTTISRPSGFMFKREAVTVRLGSIIPLGVESELAKSLSDLIARWRIDYPRRPLYISNGTAERLLTDLKDGSIDAALLDTSDAPEGFNRTLISERPLVLVGPSALLDDPSADIATLLKSNPVALASRRSGLRLGASKILAEFLRPSEIEALQMVEVQSLAIALNLVLRHDYLSVLPEGAFTAENLPVGIRYLPECHKLRMWLVWPPTAQVIAQMVIDALKDQTEMPADSETMTTICA